MATILAKNVGFCVGVKRAVDTAFEIGDETVCVLGEIIHNETVLATLAKKQVNYTKQSKTNNILFCVYIFHPFKDFAQ